MVNLDILKEHKCSAGDYKKIFTAEKLADKPKKLIELISSRVQEGVTRAMKEARLWWAIDKAYDAPFRQTAYTLVQGLLAKKIEDKDAIRIINDWGLSHLLTPIKDKNGKVCCWPRTNDPMQKLHLPTFFQIFVPLVQNYTMIRWAKIFSDIDQDPLYKYEPLKLTTKNRLKCEIITDRIMMMGTQMGYRADERQSIFQSLLYGICLNFPMESWYKEEQLDEGSKKIIVKEGVRFAMPHPSRLYYDLAHRTSTLNSDTGCMYSGYWDVVRYGDIFEKDGYYNTDKLTYGANDWISAYWNPFTTLYPCQIAFPDIKSAGAGDTDRVNKMSPYTVNEKDKAVVIVPHFQKLIPKEHGLGSYDYPVWHRFVMAQSDTPIHVEPLAYNPNVFYGCDSDSNRELNAGLGLQLLPWQDLLSNYLSQLLYSVKKNLASATFYNKNIVSEETIQGINMLGEDLYRGLNFIGIDKHELSWQLQAGKETEAFHNVVFPQHNTAEIMGSINMALSIMERSLGFSAQEVGQPAAHEQSATEVTTIHGNQSVRLEHTEGFTGEAISAKKRLLYDATMAYSDDEIFAQVGELNEQTRKQLDELGFKVEDEPEDGQTRAGVRGSKEMLTIEGFASNRDDSKRINNVQIAAAMLKIFETLMAQPMLVQSMGAKQLGDLFNQVFVYAGMPKNFRVMLKDVQDPAEQAKQMQEELAKLSEQIAQKVVQQNMGQMVDALKTKMFEPIQQAIQGLQQGVQQVAQKTVQTEQEVQQIGQATQQIGQATQVNSQKNAEQDQVLGKLISIFEQAQGAIQPPQPFLTGMSMPPQLDPNVIPNTQAPIPAGIPSPS